MKLKPVTLIILLGMALLLAGCPEEESPKTPPPDLAVQGHEKLRGYPLGISTQVTSNNLYQSICLSVDDKIILAELFGCSQASKAVHVEALIRAEIFDGDSEKVVLFGYFENDIFKYYLVSCNGYSLEVGSASPRSEVKTINKIP